MNKKGFSWISIIVVIAVLIVLGILAYFLIPQKGGEATNNSAPSSAGEQKLVALGASMTKANNLSASQVGDNDDYSFATGTKIESLFSYLKIRTKNAKFTAINLAESGVSSQGMLEKQLPNALSYHPKYATVDITADIFTSNEPDALRENLTKIVSQLKNEGATVLLGSYPNFFAYRTADFPACKEDKLNINITRLTPETLQRYNQTIKDVAESQNVIFVDVFNVLGPNDISDYDCVHANVEGQKKLAKAWIDALEKTR